MNLMIFCSNPVDGGTAKVFYESVQAFEGQSGVRVFPCVNKDNPVKIYRKIKKSDSFKWKEIRA